MTADPSSSPVDKTSDSSPPTWPYTAGAVVIAALAVGWFLMSHFVMGTAVSDAVGEAIGAALGLLVALSVVGAVSGARSANRHRSVD